LKAPPNLPIRGENKRIKEEKEVLLIFGFSPDVGKKKRRA
jgi:hypothetical protein